MIPNASSDSQPLTELVAYLFSRREAILNNWRTVCEQDSSLHRVASLTREEFNNLLPIVLDILEQRLLGKPPVADAAITATAHGLHRWHKAHNLIETLQELHHLTQVLSQEVQFFQQLVSQTDAALLLQVQYQISELMSETINGSVMKYDELQRLEAANRTASLQQAIQQMEELARQRGNILRNSSHDLRGSFSIINTTAYLLKNMDDLDELDRQQFLAMLNRNLSSVHTLLDNLLDLSRLESGEETLQIQSVDAAQLLRQVVDSAQPMATQRGLRLHADGPASLLVQTDPVKLQRIVQNLLLNALKYTSAGFISVSWSQEGDRRWNFSVQDSGYGLPDALSSLLADQLKSTVEPSSTLSPDQSEPVAVLPRDEQLPSGPELSQLASQGEGIGLQIVKRLCELIGASLDIETQAGRGTLFRIRMPVHYDP